ncbi:MAG: hypothetical protein NC343_05780 [Muribaculum sp.]|nr:hypothetical protein [Muribaculaceae bacterium]MCM1081242.1 hypothetical protein [Muribaculum sp.]
MKKLLPILTAGLALTGAAKNDVFTTSGDGKVYTFADLAAIEGSGVTKIDDNTYKMVNDLEVEAADGLTITNNLTVLLGTDVELTLKGGNFNFAPADTATFKPAEAGVKPKTIHFTDMVEPLEIKHIRIEGAGLRLGGPYPTLVENCTFYEHLANKSNYAVSFVGQSVGNIVRNCLFVRSNLSAIGAGSNVAAGVTIEDNLFEDCSTANRNYPVINEVPAAANGPIIIRRNTIKGGMRTMPGAISISNMMSMLGDHKVQIEDNYMDNSRYGINILGNYMDIRVINNKIINCHYETNAMNGGSGITINSTIKEGSTARRTKVHVEGNYIDGSLWGITVIGQVSANIGHLTDPSDPDYNPGRNVFKNNGNSKKEDGSNPWDISTPYDLYNNTTETLYAQGNTWGGPDQTPAEIEKRIFHNVDDPNLGEVIFLPAATTSGINNVDSDNVVIKSNGDGSFSVEGTEARTTVSVYDLTGVCLYNGATGESVQLNRRGLVLVVVGDKATRLAL